MNVSSTQLSRAGLIPLITGLVGTAALTFPSTSATIIWDIRWYPAYLLGAGLVAAGCFLLFVPERPRAPHELFPVLCLELIALGLVAGAYAGPFPERAMIYTFPVLIALWCGICLLLGGKRDLLRELPGTHSFQWTVAMFLLLWCGVSMQRFLAEDLLPFFDQAKAMDESVGGGLYQLYVTEKLPSLRNAHPFGHSNYVSGFLLVLLPLTLHGILRPAVRGVRAASILALVLGVTVLLSTQSRNALAGVFVGAIVYVWWTRRGRRSPPVRHLLLLTAMAALAFWLTPRLSWSRLSISPGRLGVWEAAWRTGLQYAPFGCGEGLAPEMLRRISPTLSATWLDLLQFHHTWLHLWATGGVLAFAGATGLALWIPWRLAVSRADRRPEAGPTAAALAATAVVMFADYQLDILPIALPLMFHLGLLAAFLPESDKKTSRFPDRRWLLLAPALTLALSTARIPDSVRSRHHIDLAGAAFEQERYDEAADEYMAAFDAVAEPYALNMAGRVLAADPARREEAIALFERSLDLWEPQPLAHGYLVDLWWSHASDPDTHNTRRPRILEQARRHALRRAELAPELSGSYLDLARLGHELGRPHRQTVAWLTLELLHRNPLLTRPAWEFYPELSSYREEVIRGLTSPPPAPTARAASRLDLLPAWFERLEILPPGMEPSDHARDRLNRQWERTPALRLLQTYCAAGPDTQDQKLRRLLVFVFERPLSKEVENAIKKWIDPNVSCPASVLNAGPPMAALPSWNNPGLMSRHPFSIPVPRTRKRPNPLGMRIIPGTRQRLLSPREAASWLDMGDAED